MAATVTVNDLLDEHVVLDVQCLDRVYLNGYVPTLQTSGQVWWFFTKHLGFPIASPAIMEKIGTRFRRSVGTFAEDNHIPMVRFGKDDRKIDVMRRHVAAQARTGRSGVAAIGTAQEIQNVFLATLRERSSGGAASYAFTKANRRILVARQLSSTPRGVPENQGRATPTSGTLVPAPDRDVLHILDE